MILGEKRLYYRRKLKDLKAHLTKEFGAEESGKSIKQITDAARGLEDFMYKLFGITTTTQESVEYWNE